MNAVGTVLKRHGIAKMGINLVAEEANVDKKVIYRRYGTFESLLSDYINKHDFWLNTLPQKDIEEVTDLRSYLKDLIVGQFATILESTDLQELLSWELADKTELTKQIALKRERYAQKILAKLEGLTQESPHDFSATVAILISAVYYIILHRNVSTMCGLDINKESDVQRILDTATGMFDFLFDAYEQKSKIEEIAINAHNEGIGLATIAKITGLDERRIEILIGLK